jgi:23S rRNA pseudouridine1911/1915/1917 synthase
MNTCEETLEETLIVPQEFEGERLDKFLVQSFPSYSRSYFQYLLKNEYVLVNGQKMKKRQIPKAGDEIEIFFSLTPELSLEPENIPLDILYEDKDLLIVNKPAGMVVHPAPGHPKGTFVNALLFHCKNLERADDSLRPGIVHRLDKDTSGIIIAAKTTVCHQKLVEMFAQREIQKTYLAVCIGEPENGIIDAPIGRHPVRRKEMCISEEKGKTAISHSTVLESKAHQSHRISLIQIKPITGRTHQLRVHLQHKRAPILGDPVYGIESINQKYGFKRQLLHAYTISFVHPISKQPLLIKAPLSQDMQKFIESHFSCTLE